MLNVRKIILRSSICHRYFKWNARENLNENIRVEPHTYTTLLLLENHEKVPFPCNTVYIIHIKPLKLEGKRTIWASMRQPFSNIKTKQNKKLLRLLRQLEGNFAGYDISRK
jgi:hypothetical protein